MAKQSQSDIKRRIKSVKSIEQITHALELVSVSKLRRARRKAVSGRPFREKLQELLLHLASLPDLPLEHELIGEREVQRVAYMVVTSDRGYAGGYNNRVLNLAMEVIAQETHPYDLYVVGSKGSDHFRKAHIPITAEMVGLGDDVHWQAAQHIADVFMDAYVNRVVDAIYLIYTEFVSSMTHHPVVKPLLPIVSLRSQADQLAQINRGLRTVAKEAAADVGVSATVALQDYLWEPSPAAVLNILLPRYVETVVYGALSESQASEHGARMTAMQSATENAQEMITALTMSFNQARQASITREISEIVGGAAVPEEK